MGRPSDISNIRQRRPKFAKNRNPPSQRPIMAESETDARSLEEGAGALRRRFRISVYVLESRGGATINTSGPHVISNVAV